MNSLVEELGQLGRKMLRKEGAHGKGGICWKQDDLFIALENGQGLVIERGSPPDIIYLEREGADPEIWNLSAAIQVVKELRLYMVLDDIANV